MTLIESPATGMDSTPLETETPYQIPPHDQMPVETEGTPCHAPKIIHHAADPLTLDQAGESTIAEQEIDIAEAIGRLGEKLNERDAKIKDLETRLAAQISSTQRAMDQRDGQYAENKRLKTLVDGLYDDRAVLADHVRDLTEQNDDLKAKAATCKRTIEVKTVRQPSDEELAALLNEGWRVVFETIYSLPNYGSEAFHHVRLEREIIAPPAPPKETATEAEVYTALFAPVTPAPQPVPVHPQPTDIVFHVPGTPTLYEAIDPAEIDMTMPLAERISKYGAAACAAAWDEQIKGAMKAVAFQWNETQQRATSLPIRIQQQHA